MFLRLSFASGIVRPMLATTSRPGPFGKFDAEAVARCKNMGESATVLDEDLKVVGEVKRTVFGYQFEATHETA